VDGILFPFGDADALARAMRKVISDAHLRDQLGSAAQAFANENHSLEKTWRAYAELIV